MKTLRIIVLFLCVLYPTQTVAQVVPLMRTAGKTDAPHGHIAFCKIHRDSCIALSPSKLLQHTPALLQKLDTGNRSINMGITPETDLVIYGRNEVWSSPGRRGDCEEFAIAKQILFQLMGIDPGNLLLTVVKDENGEGHMVLSVLTSQGMLILDNKTNAIKFWHETGYHFVMRQSVRHWGQWVLIRNE